MPAKPFNQLSGMPQMRAAFNGWTIKITILKVIQTIVNGFVQENTRSISFDGIWQPLSPELVKLKEEGQRQWEWIWLHVQGNKMLFVNNDRIIYNGVRYKVMATKDYTLNNYAEYHLVQDYQNE